MRQPIGCLLIISLACFAPVGLSAGGAQQPVAKAKPAAKDSFGDPLPAGVFYRLGSVRMRHQNTQALIFSADGSHLLSQGGTSDLRVWDVATGRNLRQIELLGEFGCRFLIASPDDRYLACVRGSSSQTLLLDKATGKELARLDPPTNCCALAFSRDSKELVGLTREKTVVKWDTAQRKETARIKLDMSKVEDNNLFHDQYVSLSPNGDVVAYTPPQPAKGKATIPWHFWDSASGKECRPPIKTTGRPSQACWSPDGRIIAVVNFDNALEIRDTVAGKRLALEEAGPLNENSWSGSWSQAGGSGMAFHPGGKLLAVSNQGKVALWDLNAKKPLWQIDLYATVLAFSPNGKTLAAGGDVITLVETATGERVGFSRRGPGWFSLVGWKFSPSFLRDGRSFTIYDDTGMSQIETTTGKRLRTYYSRKLGWYSFGGLGDQGRLLFCRGADEHDVGHVFLFEAATGKELWRRPQQPSALYFAADGKKIATLSWEQDVFTTLDVATGRAIKKVSIHSYKDGYSTDRAVSDDLSLIATTKGNLYNIDLWDLDTGKKLRTLDGPEGHGEMFFLPGSRLLVAAPERSYHERDQKRAWTRVWDVATGQIVRSFDEPLAKVSDDGRWLVLQRDKTHVIRHLQTGRLVATLDGLLPDANWRFVEISPDGSLVAGRSESWHEVGLWDTFTGRRVCRFVEPLSEFQRAEFSPDGRTLVLTVRDGGSMLVCDVTGLATEPGKIPSQDLTPTEADRYWLDLTSEDGPRSHRARWRLVAGGEYTVKMLQRRLRRAEPLDGKQLAALIAALDSGSFAERQKSSQLLEKMDFARPALAESLQRNPSLEMKRRIEQILATLDDLPWDVELARTLRGVLLLEQIGTPPARQLLQTLAGGAAGSLLTHEAQAALQRMTPAEQVRGR